MKIESFSAAQLETLRAEYAKLQTVPTSALPKFRALFDKCSALALKELIAAKINFVSKLALNAQTRRAIAA